MMFKSASLTALLASSLAAATPLSVAEGTSFRFSLISTHSGDSNVHLRPINASNGQFFLGKDTQTYCPKNLPKDSPCPNGGTSFAQTAGSNTLGMNVIVPGGQQVFIDPSGYLGFTQAHSAALPKGAITQGFQWIPPAQQGSVGTLKTPKPLTACPTGNPGEYQVHAVLEGLSYIGCIGINAAGTSVQGAGAWQYD